MCIPTMMKWATKEQCDRYVKPALMAKKFGASFLRTAAGSDVGSANKCEKDGDEWVINGQKVWTSGAHFAITALSLPASTRPYRSIKA